MHRQLDELQKKNEALRQHLIQMQMVHNAPKLLPKSTPQRHAAEILNAVDVTPLPNRVRALAPYVETMARVHDAPTATKKQLFKPMTRRRRTGCTKALSAKVGLSRKYIFKQHNVQFMKKSVARAKKPRLVSF